MRYVLFCYIYYYIICVCFCLCLYQFVSVSMYVYVWTSNGVYVFIIFVAVFVMSSDGLCARRPRAGGRDSSRLWTETVITGSAGVVTLLHVTHRWVGLRTRTNCLTCVQRTHANPQTRIWFARMSGIHTPPPHPPTHTYTHRERERLAEGQ